MAAGIAKKIPVISEISRQAKVSRAAAYAVLNGTKSNSTIGVCQEKRKRVLQVAKKLGYVRNELARSLVTGKTYTIGVLVHSLKNHFFIDFFSHLDDVCYEAGYSVSLASSEFNRDREARCLLAFLARKADALVINRDPAHANDDLLRRIARQGIPIITVGELCGQPPTYPNVTFDEDLGERLAAEYVWSLGHRRILYFTTGKIASTSLVIYRMRRGKFSAAWDRISGGQPIARFETADPMHGGNELAAALAKTPEKDRPTAIACGTDRLAISLVSALKAHHIAVPRDISVIGYDDIDAAQAAVPLTTIRLPTDKLAQGAWALLRKRLLAPAEAGRENAPECLVIPPDLIIRESTGSPQQKT